MLLHLVSMEAQAPTWPFIMAGAFMHLVFGGVTLHLDVPNEDLWLELRPEFEPEMLTASIEAAENLGFVPMDDPEAIEVRDDGTIRHWMEQVWFPEEGEEMSAAS